LKADGAESDEPVGPFSSWRVLYALVVLYGIGMIILLLVLTWLLDPGIS
jgi:hypothetical protein